MEEPIKVLLVDDEEDIVDTVKYSLELRGYDVDVAYDGISALSKARTNQYAVLLLDVMLPGKNGYEVSRLLKDEMEAGVLTPFPIVLITARKLDSDYREEFVSTWSKADASAAGSGVQLPARIADARRRMRIQARWQPRRRRTDHVRGPRPAPSSAWHRGSNGVGRPRHTLAGRLPQPARPRDLRLVSHRPGRGPGV